MPEQQPDTVTELEVLMRPWVEGERGEAARVVLAWVEERYVPRADAVPRDEHERVLALVKASAHALCRNVSYVVDRWNSHAPEALLCDLRALVGDASLDEVLPGPWCGHVGPVVDDRRPLCQLTPGHGAAHYGRTSTTALTWTDEQGWRHDSAGGTS